MSAEAPHRLSPISNEELEAQVATASVEEMRRALRIVLGAELAYWERDLQSGEIWYSPSFFRVLGMPPTRDRELINARVHPDDRAEFEAAYGAALHGGGAFSYDVRYLDTHNAYRWARAFGRVWLDPASGKPLRLVGTLIDVHAERQARLDAHEHAQRYQRALDASVEAHFERTAGLDDFFVSDNFPRLLGYPPGTSPPDVEAFLGWVHPDDRPALTAEIGRAWAAPGTWESTYRLRQADGGWRWFRGRGRSELDGQGRVRMSGMVGDVHQQQLDRDELAQHRHHLRRMVAERTEKLDAALAEAQRQREQAERASRAKSEFLAHMSHELRTPLNGVLGLTELALRVAAEPAQQRYLEVALSSGRALLQLINEVLDFSRLEAGRISLANEPYDVAELLTEVMRPLMLEARAKGLSIYYDWVGPPVWVRGDPARVRQVVTNLAGNAVKFTQRGHVGLRGELVPDGRGEARATVRIDDTGPGIDAAHRDRVFQAFVQADASLTRAHGGTGLGLAISRQLARAMGGDVLLERSDATGSRFAFSWPVALAPDPRPPLPATRGHAWLAYSTHFNATELGGRIERLGWSREICVGFAALVERARRGPPPDLVIVSEQAMGADADLAALRAALPHTRVVLLVRPDWNRPALECAAGDLRMQVAVMPLAPYRLHALLADTVTPPRHDAAAGAPAAAARVLVVEDNPVNLLIAQEFLRQLGHDPVGAADGHAAVAACIAAPPAIVLMDLQMPVMDGFEAARRLRALQTEGRLPPFPIVALTAHAGDADRLQSQAAGMDGHLTKPILLDALKDALGRWLT
jgi:signal transduction histidine kinase/ActR/RegA family two-component response regulator